LDPMEASTLGGNTPSEIVPYGIVIITARVDEYKNPTISM